VSYPENRKEEKTSPSCTIGVLQNNMEILKGTQISFPVFAEDEDGYITSVILNIDGLGSDTSTTAPYQFSWATQNESAGSHSIQATASDNEGLVTIHEVMVNVITTSDPVLPCPEAISISYEGQTYNTIKIGDQCWLKENLNVTTNHSVYYNDDPANGDIYGQLYPWEEAKTVCPPGWHLPTYENWCTLVQFVDASAECLQESENGTDAGFKLKSANNWLDDLNGSDQFGFSALPGGLKSSAGAYTKMGRSASFWSETEANDGFVYFWHMNDETTRIMNNKVSKSENLSVRCIKE